MCCEQLSAGTTLDVFCARGCRLKLLRSGPCELNMIMSHLLIACCVESHQGVQSIWNLFIIPKSLSSSRALQPRMARPTPFWFPSLFDVRAHV